MSSKGKRALLAGSGLRLRRGFGAGAGDGVNINIAGIKPGDEIVSVFQLTAPSAASADAIVADRTAVASITGAGTIKVTGFVTTGNQVECLWLSR